MQHLKIRFALIVGLLAVFASALGFGEGLDPLHFGW
jgi:hypothetical protein